MKQVLFVIIFLFLCVLSFAQQGKRWHQTFEVSDSVSILQLEVFDEYVVEPWAGTNILVEINIKLYEASTAILDFLVEAGRYKVESKMEEGKLILASGLKGRHPVKYKGSECPEIIELKLFIPQDFATSEPHQWVRQAAIGTD